MENKIDIVILWVNGNDPKWVEEKNKYLGIQGDSYINRFRDWDNLQYLFRGIEKYASWVNNVFFITWDHLPKWLNLKNEKLKIVRHQDFIPQEYLPTFNSNVIEMNLHRIKALSSEFILFNDDLFILNNIEPEDFFKDNLPKDMYIEYKKKNCSKRHLILRKNYLQIVNKYFVKKQFVKNNFSKVINSKYGWSNLKTIKLLPSNNFHDFYCQHLTQPFLKETFNTIWEKEYNALDCACKNRFRADTDIGTAVCRYWQILSGNFIPTNQIGKYFKVDDKDVINAIEKRKYKIICLNDATVNLDFENIKDNVNNAFEKIFPEKSSFEI